MVMGYPAPRAPELKSVTKKELVARIRKYLVDSANTAPQEIATSPTGHVPTYDVKQGDKILVVGAQEYDLDVIDAYAEAFRQKGAKVDQLLIDLGRLSQSPEDAAAQEALSLVVGGDNAVYSRYCNVVMASTIESLVRSDGYNMIVAGMGPPPDGITTKWRRMMYVYNEEVAGPRIEFPMEVQVAIDKVVWGQISSLVKCRFTDPEGTDFTWTNYDDERAMAMGHEFAKPEHIGHGGRPDCNGVVAGTLNHVGAFPHVKAHVKDDLVVRVEGGGKYGDAWREKLEQLNKLELPEVPLSHGSASTYKPPSPGFFWFWEMAVGTAPKVFRHPRESRFECFANFLHDRERAGYVHHGFGAPGSSTRVSYTKRNVPWTHVHIHNMFSTFTGRDREGREVTVIDKGHLTALDDPRVREVASKHGRPEDLLREVWVPAVPGINADGDYWKDYARNPAGWLLSREQLALAR